MRVESCRFEASAFRPEDEPRATGPEIVFLGRSNVGKSSMINRLLGAKGLARTSGAPGRTQSVNFYRVNEAFWFVDLPGYGYAKVPESVRRAWRPLVEGYLERHAPRIALAVVLLDARREAGELDVLLVEWLAERGIPRVLAATKADKLSGNGRAETARALGAAFEDEVLLVSAETGLGTRALWSRLDAGLSRAGEEKRNRWTSAS